MGSLLIVYANIDPGVTVAIVAAGLGPVGAYMIAARRLSGKIANSDAEQLWAESRSIREWATSRINMYEQRIMKMQKEIDELSARCEVMEGENTDLHTQLNEARTRISELIELASKSRKGTALDE